MPMEPEVPEPLSIGTRLTIDGRQFEVDSVDDHTQNVSLRDVTFEGGTGFPIFRKESIDYVRAHMEQPDIVQETAAPQADEPPAALTPPKKKKRNELAYPLDADGRNYRITDDHIGEGAPLERFQRNLDAIRTLKTVEAENRAATAEEQAVLAQYYVYVAAGVTDLVNILGPEMVLIGGGISRQGERLLSPVREYVAANCFGGHDRLPPVIEAARLGNEAGIIGAAAL